MFLLLPLLLFMVLLPVAPFPDYPPTAHLVPDDGIPGKVYPLLSNAYRIPVIHRQLVYELYGSLAVLLIVSCGIVALGDSRNAWLKAAAFLAAAACIDTILPEKLALIGPIAATTRLVPGWSNLCVTPLVLAFATVILAVGVSSRKGSPSLFGTLLVIGAPARFPASAPTAPPCSPESRISR